MVLDKNSENISSCEIDVSSEKNNHIEDQIRQKEEYFIKRFGISVEKLKELYSLSSKKELERLNNELTKLIEDKKEQDSPVELFNELVELFNELIELREKIKKEVLTLKEEIDDSKETLIKKYFWLNVRKYDNPKNVKEHIIKASLWLWESFLWAWKLTYDILTWIIKLPRDLYMMIIKKWEYKWFKDI